MTGTPSTAAISSAAIAAANSGAERGVNPRTCRLPRAVISIVPLPCAARRRTEGGEGFERNALRRRQPHQQPVAGRHRRRQARAGAAAMRRVHGGTSCRERQRSHRYRCAADATARGGVRRRGARRSRARPRGSRAAGSRARAGRRDRRRARDRTARSAPRPSSRAKATSRSTVSASSAAPRGPWRIRPAMKRGLTARPRTMRASAASSGRARGRCGSVRSSMMRSGVRPSIAAAAAKPPTKAASSAPSSRSRPGSSPGCTSRSALATRSAKPPGTGVPAPSAPP